MPRDLPRRIGFWGASAVMVGVIIGSGIYRTPPEIAARLDSPALILVLWFAGGLLSLCGALTYAEMATMYPESGGVYVFLREGFGRAVAFVFGWTYMLITKPFAAAGIAVVGTEHLLKLCRVDIPDADQRRLVVDAITTLILVVLTVINVVGVGPSTAVAKVLTGLKFAALAAIVGVAAALMKGSAVNFAAHPSPEPFMVALAPVMMAIMWTYDGWSDVGSIAGEVENPSRQLPRIYLVGTAAVTLLYLAINAVYIALVPLSEMRSGAGGHPLETVAPLVMQRLIGEAGGIAVTAIILVSTLGSSHSSVLTGARVTFAQASDGLLFRSLAAVHPKFQTPAVSLWFQLVMSCVALWHPLLLGPAVGRDGKPSASTFQQLADGFVFTMWIFYGLAACSIFILRVKRPGAERPYRCWGYPLIPALFVAAAAAMTGLTIWGDVTNPASRGVKTLPWLGVLIAGLPVYFVWMMLFPPNREEPIRPGP